MPVSCDLELTKKIGMDVVDEHIPMDDQWAEAEKRDRKSDLWRQSSLDR
jgi:hypothetical protein